jgi:hypothetical protein
MKCKATLVAPVIALLVGFCAAGQSVTNTKNGDSAHMPKPTATNIASDESGKSNSVNAEGRYKMTVDPQTGQYIVVGFDRQTLTSKDKDGKILWSTNVCQSELARAVERSDYISSIGIITNRSEFQLHVRLGYSVSSVEVDIRTGKVTPGAIYRLP